MSNSNGFARIIKFRKISYVIVYYGYTVKHSFLRVLFYQQIVSSSFESNMITTKTIFKKDTFVLIGNI
jgi:hypothetical protein